jgi:hypothetical protein
MTTLNNRNKQQVYDDVVHHLMTQKDRSLLSGLPALRGAFGTKDPIGIYVTDEEYDECVENHDILTQAEFFRFKGHTDLADGLTKHERLLKQLCQVHDSVAPRWWIKMLKKVARAEHLSYKSATYYEPKRF